LISLSRNIVFRQALFDHDCMLVPVIDLEWQSSRFVDYYYGVRPEEAAPDRPAYVGRDTMNEGTRLTGFYRINRSWTAFAGMYAAFLGPGITDSPLVKRHVATRGYVGAAWLF
jgi:MipA family protein